MKEIGGYFEMETLRGQEYYPDLLKFNLGRTAAVWYLEQCGCSTVYVPSFLCDSVTDELLRAGMKLVRWGMKKDFTPDETTLPKHLKEDEWLYLVSWYGQLKDETILYYKEKYGNVFLDFTHAFFQRPVKGVAAAARVRKFFGVTDGAYLQTDRPLKLPEETDISSERLSYVTGRYEENAGIHYQQMLDTAHSYVGADAKKMSALTENLLRGIDYEFAAERRMENYLTLKEKLEDLNPLEQEHLIRVPDIGPFMYPLYVKNGIQIRKKLAGQKIFIPTYWSNVMKEMPEDSLEYDYAANILALPCDQRYGREEMEKVAEAVRAEAGR